MSGIIVLFVIGLWMAIAFYITYALTMFIAKVFVVETPWKAVPVFFSLFIPLLVLPIIDDVLIGREFKKLCEEYSVTKIDRDKGYFNGKTVYTGNIVNTEIKRGLMEAFVQKWEYLDATTDEVVIFNRTLNTRGGFISSFAPDVIRALTFHTSCSPDGGHINKFVFKELGMTQIDRDNLETWRSENTDN